MPRLPLRPKLATLAALLCLAGFALLVAPWRLAAALGLECLAAAFWLAARAAADAETQLRRWEWLRRPATALWLATAMEALERAAIRDGIAPESVALALVAAIGELAVFWAGLDLLGALPGARTFSDRSGPLAGGAFRMPSLLPAAGALVFLRHSAARSLVFAGVDWAQVILLAAAFIAVLRAFGRQSWRRCLRWLIVTESALAALLASVGTVHAWVAILLWVGACGGLAVWLVGEHRGAVLRRDPRLYHLWRAAGWASTSLLAVPLLVAYVHGLQARWGMASGVGVVVMLVAWIVVRRPQPAPERRAMARRGAMVPIGLFAGLATLAIGPASLALAWRMGYRAPAGAVLGALAPCVLGGGLALWTRMPAPRAAGRAVAQGLFRTVARLEHQLVARGGGLGRWLASPLRDLHSGDAQEYLLFLVGLSVLMLLLPILE